MPKTFSQLPNRGLIHIEGDDRVDFLQGLVSQDATKLSESQIQYACLLTPQGKFLHDFFMLHGDGFIMLDCEGGERAQDLFERLNKYRLRADVRISVEVENVVYVSLNSENGLPDPRHFKLGVRSFEKPENALEESFLEWDRERILLTIPDGSRDMIIERSTMLECGLDRLNAVDWDKGCWMGQELTARMHYRGLGKKHLRSVAFDGPAPTPFSELKINDKLIGDMRAACGGIGLAMIKDSAIESLKESKGKDGNNHSLRLLG